MPDTIQNPFRLTVSKHAQLRYRQRCDTTEPFVADTIRELLADAERADRPGVDGVAWDTGEILVVTDDDGTEAVTVLSKPEVSP